MTQHAVGTRNEWRDARLRLLAVEKEHVRTTRARRVAPSRRSETTREHVARRLPVAHP